MSHLQNAFPHYNFVWTSASVISYFNWVLQCKILKAYYIYIARYFKQENAYVFSLLFVKLEMGQNFW